MVRIENPEPGKRAVIGIAAALSMVSNGVATPTVQINGQLTTIRLVSSVVQRGQQDRGYDSIKRILAESEMRKLPLINPDKMIREEKSSRKFSFAASVEQHRGRIPMPRLRPGRGESDSLEVGSHYQKGRNASC